MEGGKCRVPTVPTDSGFSIGVIAARGEEDEERGAHIYKILVGTVGTKGLHPSNCKGSSCTDTLSKCRYSVGTVGTFPHGHHLSPELAQGVAGVSLWKETLLSLMAGEGARGGDVVRK